jgi:hypothetical protein
MSDKNYRLYSFVANGYLSPLQHGLQTAHAVGDMSVKYNDDDHADHAYRTWAGQDKVIIICAAFNSKGVLDCFAELKRTGGDALCLPVSIFFEDEDSLNGAATACAVVVPQQYWDTRFVPPPEPKFSGYDVNPLMGKWVYLDAATGREKEYPLTHPEGQFIDHIKKYRLA